jgi:hypothetical protein
MSIYRLSLLGLVVDYTTDWQTQFAVKVRTLSADQVEENLVRYISRYRAQVLGESILQHAKSRATLGRPYDHLIAALSDFIYEEIEKGRRQSISNLIRVMRVCQEDGTKLASEIDNHLSTNTFTGRLAQLAQRVDRNEWWEVMREVTSTHLATQMLASCRRTLESIPDHPGLIMLEAIGMMWLLHPDMKVVCERLQYALEAYGSGYGGTQSDLEDSAAQFLREAQRIRADLFEVAVRRLVARQRIDLFAVAAYPMVTKPELRQICSVPWIRQITAIARAARTEHMGEVE